MELTYSQQKYLTELVINEDSIENLANKFFDTNEVIEKLTNRASKQNKSSCVHQGWLYAATIVHKRIKMKAMGNLAQQLVDYIEKEDPYGTKQSS